MFPLWLFWLTLKARFSLWPPAWQENLVWHGNCVLEKPLQGVESKEEINAVLYKTCPCRARVAPCRDFQYKGSYSGAVVRGVNARHHLCTHMMSSQLRNTCETWQTNNLIRINNTSFYCFFQLFKFIFKNLSRVGIQHCFSYISFKYSNLISNIAIWHFYSLHCESPHKC